MINHEIWIGEFSTRAEDEVITGRKLIRISGQHINQMETFLFKNNNYITNININLYNYLLEYKICINL